METKRLTRLDNGTLCEDASEAFDLPFASITREALNRLPREPLAEPDRPLVRATGGGYSYAPITEGVPDIPERPTVTVERFEPEPIDTSKTMVALIWAAAIAAGLLIGYGLRAGVVSLRGF